MSTEDKTITEEETAIKEMKDKCIINSLNYCYLDGRGATAFNIQPNISVVGRLKENVEAWGEFGANDFILDTLITGYKIPFIKTPQNARFQNNLSALRNQEFVSETIKDLLLNGCIVQVQEPPTVVSPLTVSEKGDKKTSHIGADVYME